MILPVLLPDLDLDWAVHTGSLDRRRGLLEPAGPTLGVDAVATADVVLAPGLAVDRTGMRLGKGGGSYDRALGRVPVGTPVCVLLYDDEVRRPGAGRAARPPGHRRRHPVGGSAVSRRLEGEPVLGRVGDRLLR